MRSSPYSTAATVVTPERPRRALPRAGSMRRRPRGPREIIVPPAPHHDSPQALYRAEKARRASQIDSTIMVEAKRLYDEAVAESLKKRAGGAGRRVGAASSGSGASASR